VKSEINGASLPKMIAQQWRDANYQDGPTLSPFKRHVEQWKLLGKYYVTPLTVWPYDGYNVNLNNIHLQW
jgi:hypothetical protein